MLRTNAAKVASIISAAGGQVVGRTRLQKIVYLLQSAGYIEDFTFAYKHYGPFSEELATATKYAGLLGLLSESKSRTTWGGTYSIYSTNNFVSKEVDENQHKLLRLAADVDAVELELLATAVFLGREGYPDPWGETERRKPEKSDNGRLVRARSLFEVFREIDAPKPWPVLQ